MNSHWNRRTLLASLAAGAAAGAGGLAEARPKGPGKHRFFFTSNGKTVLMDTAGEQRVLEFDVANQASWQPTGTFSDGRRVLLLSLEPARYGPDRPYDEYYWQTRTHLWIYDLEGGSLKEVVTRRMAPFYTPQLLLSDDRVLMQVSQRGVVQIWSMDLDGGDAREFTRAGEGTPYGFSLSPDGKRVAFHLAGNGYQIWTSDPDGGNRTRVAAHPDHLYFGPCWSPDGRWLAFEDCRFREDPGHDWADVCICRPDGSEQRLLTAEQALWFAATYGPRERHGGGSNLLSWTRDGAVLCSRRLPGSRVPWEFQTGRRDTDHFNREFKPEAARGGTEICRIDLTSGQVTRLTGSKPPVWDFRAAASPDGRRILFCRAETGGSPSLWIMDSDGRHPRRLTGGLEERGVDHPRWLTQPS